MKETTWEDPIVAEIHRVRREIAAEYHDDLHAYLTDLMAQQSETITGAELRTRAEARASAPATVRETPPKYGSK